MRTAKVLLAMILVSSLMARVRWANAASNTADYRLTKKVVLGGEGGWDYFEVDPTTSHVFIPRRDHILELKRAFLSADASVAVLDMDKMQVTHTIALPGKDPDAILYDSSVNRVFTFNGGGTKDATAIDVATEKIAGSIALGGKPETAQADGGGNIYVNIEDKSQIIAFDSKTLKVQHTWPVAPCKDPAGMAIDVEHKRLFVGCRNQLMAVVDYTNGKVVASVPIGKGVDANRFDPATGLAFASCNDGTIAVAHQDSPDKYSVVQTITTQRGARTMALDTNGHIVYTVTAEFEPPPPATPQNPHPWPKVISKTFTLLIYGQ